MKTNHTPPAISCCPLKTIMRVGVFILFAFVTLPLFSASSASLSEGLLQKSLAGMSRSMGMNSEYNSPRTIDSVYNQFLSIPQPGMEPLLPLPQAGTETVAIYQSDCTTPATDFTLTQTLCAKLTSGPVGSRPTQVLRRLSIVGP